jgi:ceramide glucosyltransferase
MTILATLLLVLTLLNIGLICWQWHVAWRFPLHHRQSSVSGSPPVTLLKPLKGCDAETAECLRSWLVQDYAGPIQILFGVASEGDPVCGIVRELISAHPHHDAQLIVCGEPRWSNAKASILVQLQKLASHEILVVSDADVRVPPDLLGQLVRAFSDPNVGLVNCLYRYAKASTLAMRWEAFTLNADFWSQVLQARSLKPLNFALGAVMAMPRPHLDVVGGFAAVADHLADDYELGNRLARLGARVELSPVVVDCCSPPMNLSETWDHQVRWARTIRICEPLPYALSLVSNGTLWPLLSLLAHPHTTGIIASLVCLALRVVTALYCEKKMTRKTSFLSLLIVPVKDLLQVILWARAFSSNRVSWRGEALRAMAGGRLERCPDLRMNSVGRS